MIWILLKQKLNQLRALWIPWPKFRTTQRGISLVELLLSVVLIGIVMLGVIGVNTTLERVQGGGQKLFFLRSKVMAAMHTMKREVFLAIGNSGDMGVRTTVIANSIDLCLRNDVNATPDDFNDDTWTCYYHGASNDLHRCTNFGAAFFPFVLYSKCVSSGGSWDPNFEIPLTDPNFFNVVLSPDGQIDYVEILLNAVVDSSIPVHSVDNPTYSLSTRIRPASHY